MGSWRTPAEQAADVAALAHRLTNRDRSIVYDIGRLRTLTLRQVARLHFTSHSSARDRLMTLVELGVLRRFRTSTRSQYCYVLAVPGLRLFAPMLEQARAEDHILDRMEQAHPTVVRATRVAAEAQVANLVGNPMLAHLLGSNDFYTRLVAACRTAAGWDLERWYSERQTSWATAPTYVEARPDGAADLEVHGRKVGLWLEHDTGTETLGRLVDKLRRYGNGGGRALLIELTKPGREFNFHTSAKVVPDFPIATATVDRAGDLTAPVWWKLGDRGPFRPLHELDNQ